MISIIYDTHHTPNVIICGRNTQSHMTHCATQIDFHTRMKKQLSILHDHHVNTKGTDVARKAQASYYFLLDSIKQTGWHIATYHVALRILRSKYVALIGTINSMEQRKSQIMDPTVFICNELHSEVLYLIIIRLGHDASLRLDDVDHPIIICYLFFFI